MTLYTATNAATLTTALADAVGGDRIELVAGDYGSLNIIGMTFSSDVTIVSADQANPAIIHELDIDSSTRIVFDGILFDYAAGPVFRPFWLKGAAFITIRNSVFNGAEVPSGSGEFGTGYGLNITDSDNVIIENNEFFNFSRGLVVVRSTNLIVKANEIHSLSSDGMDFVSVDGLLVEGNWIHDFKIDPDGGQHPDMIQFWVVANETSARNAIIRGNFLDAGVGAWTQSIFMGNDLGQIDFETYAYRNILIEDNVIYNDHVHGITIGEIDGLTLRNNTLLHDPATVPQLGWAPQFRVWEEAKNVNFEGNIVAGVWNWDAITTQPGWTATNNLLLNYDPASPEYYASLFVNALAMPATLADLRAVAGGIIEVNGHGAAMTRADIDITLEVGPNVVAPPAPPPEPDVCEALLAEALAVVADFEAQLAASQAALAAMTNARDVALASLAEITTLWSEAVNTLVTAEAALVAMTAERDTAVLDQAAAETVRDMALADLETAQTQLAVVVAKLDAIRVIVEAN